MKVPIDILSPTGLWPLVFLTMCTPGLLSPKTKNTLVQSEEARAENPNSRIGTISRTSTGFWNVNRTWT